VKQVKQVKTVGWRSAGKSHVGAVRTLNEDAFLDRPDQGIWAVADGMGGHEAGDKASISVVTALAMVSEASSLSKLIGDAKVRLGTVNDVLRAMAGNQAGTIGTTVVALMSQGTHVALLWAGDSRAYLYRRGQLTQLTLDHSRVQELIDHGLIEPDEASEHPEANIITRAIGVSPAVEFDTKIVEAEPGDSYLLCSDGLYRSVEESEIARCLELPGCNDACQELIGKALDGGGSDNISVIVIRPGFLESTTRNRAISRTSELDDDLTTLDLTRLPDKP
jgi:serine/threonine protein phosphatase PrpC